MKKFFSRVTSVVTTGAPRRPERGEFPNVSAAGFAYAEVSNQRLTVRSSDAREDARSRFGRSDPAGKALVVLAEVMTVNVGPDSAVSSKPTFQPPSTPFTIRLPLNLRT